MLLVGSLAAKLVLVLSGRDRRRGIVVPRLMLLGQPLLHREVSIL